MDAITMSKSLNIPRSTLISHMINDFELRDYKSNMRYFELKYWTPEYFFTQLQSGTIFSSTLQFMIVYKDCTPARIRKHVGQIKLSFRAAKEEFRMLNYVIVTIVKTN